MRPNSISILFFGLQDSIGSPKTNCLRHLGLPPPTETGPDGCNFNQSSNNLLIFLNCTDLPYRTQIPIFPQIAAGLGQVLPGRLESKIGYVF